MDNLSVVDYYIYFLSCPLAALVIYVDLYNAGRLQPTARQALETIEGLELDD